MVNWDSSRRQMNYMKLFRVFDEADFVLDACVVLDLRRLPPERGDKFLAILEELEDQVWITLTSLGLNIAKICRRLVMRERNNPSYSGRMPLRIVTIQ